MHDKWHHNEIELVRKLADKGYSASEMADKLSGRSRNAVIGLCFRKNIKLSGQKINHSKEKFPIPPISFRDELLLRKLPDPIKYSKPDGCQFIFGDAKLRHFCGQTVLHGSFCLSHALVCYRVS